jgi:hypothetical protein
MQIIGYVLGALERGRKIVDAFHGNPPIASSRSIVMRYLSIPG